MNFKDRIKELRRVPAGELKANPRNWRTHPSGQKKALAGILAEVGISDACIARELPDGSLELIDGHLRKDMLSGEMIPVLVLDVNKEEADKLLLSIDPLAGMAGNNTEVLKGLLESVKVEDAALKAMLEGLACSSGFSASSLDESQTAELDDDDNPEAEFLAPFPYFGGKSRIARQVWKRFGDVKGYIEPFFGSGACLLNRSLPFEGTETVNDFDGLISNFWRAVQTDPDGVAKWADWPVNECCPSGTMITTPHADVPIESIHTGMMVIGWDGKKPVWTKVLAIKESFAQDFVQVADLRITPNHPVWTEQYGYIQAGILKGDEDWLVIEHDINHFRGDSVYSKQTQKGETDEDTPDARETSPRKYSPKDWRGITQQDFYDHYASTHVSSCQESRYPTGSSHQNDGKSSYHNSDKGISKASEGGKSLHSFNVHRDRKCLRFDSSSRRIYKSNARSFTVCIKGKSPMQRIHLHRPVVVYNFQTTTGNYFAEGRLVHNCDLHARHAWLVERKDSLQAKLEGDPEYSDRKIAGWWCWGTACWIGGGFCSGNGPWRVQEIDGVRQLVQLGNVGQGVTRQHVELYCDKGINRQANESEYAKPGRGECGLKAWMIALSERLRRVRVCCGDWRRICGGADGDALSHFFSGGEPCGVFLDPPYSTEANRNMNCYRVESGTIAHEVSTWAIKHGDDPRLRIALCGYEGEHIMPGNWSCTAWKAAGGMAGIGDGKTQGKENAKRERIWFSPHCLK